MHDYLEKWRNGGVFMLIYFAAACEMREAMHCAMTIALPLAKALHP